MKKNAIRVLYGIGMGLIWSAVLSGILNSPAGIVIGVCLGALYMYWGPNAARAKEQEAKDSKND
ncbi:MAG: hypothetical protein IJI52_03325 [Solobacterium sp.]|nr:hypothetical protein [Solobacterium sp.]MBR0213465.1 hypothetical protein [Solobacterium sp.]